MPRFFNAASTASIRSVYRSSRELAPERCVRYDEVIQEDSRLAK
jgi:hypothetical protein